MQQRVDGGGPLSTKMVDAMLACSDGLRQYVEGLKQGNASSAALGRFAQELLLAGQTAGGPGDATTPVAVVPQLHAKVAAVAGEPDTTLVGEAYFQPALPLVGLKARLIYEKLAGAGEVCYFQPAPEQLDEMEELRQVSFAVNTPETPETLRKRLQIAGVERVAVERLAAAGNKAVSAPRAEPALLPAATSATTVPAAMAAPAAAAETAEKGRPADNAKPTETLRVDIERLDELMNLAGQLVINKARFAQIGQRLKGTLGSRRSLQVLGPRWARWSG